MISNHIPIKTAEEIAIMHEGGRRLRQISDQLYGLCQAGRSLRELDQIARQLIRQAGGQPAFLGYRANGSRRPFSAAICTSLNAVVVHGLPTDYRLQSDDLLKVDIGLLYQGYYTDTAFTVIINPENVRGIRKKAGRKERLIEVTREALMEAIKLCWPGKFLGDIGTVISKRVRQNGFTVIRDLTGHGIGQKLHEQPTVFNEGLWQEGVELKEGMVLAIEPMVSAGSAQVVRQPDDSYVTVDGSLSAHFEETVAITKNGPLVLTR